MSINLWLSKVDVILIRKPLLTDSLHNIDLT